MIEYRIRLYDKGVLMNQLDTTLKDGVIAEKISTDITAQWQEIVNALAKLMNVPAALIMRLNDKKIEVFRTSLSDNNPYKLLDNEYFFDSGLYCETVIRSDEKLHVPNALKDKKWKNNPDIALNMISYLGFPIKHSDSTPFGTLCILDTKERHYSEDEENLLLQFKNMIESHLQLIETNKKFERMAYYDHLTDIYNRRYFFEIATSTISLAKRDQKPLSISMIDIDNFKSINDTYGHNVGDEVIKSLTKEVSLCIRESDIFARFGGEEFILLLSSTDVNSATTISEKIRVAIENIQVNKNISFTISMGIAEFNFSNDQLHDVIKRADEKLYEAKTSGKNKVVS